MASFLQKRQIDKSSTEFWDLIERGEIQAALGHFEEALDQHGADVDKAVRAAYHFHRWLAQGADADLRAVELLASRELETSQITRAARVIRRLRRESDLGGVLRQQRPDLITAPHEKSISRQARNLELLALTILETYRLRKEPDNARLAHRIQRGLPSPTEFDARTRLVWNHLFLWSAWNRKLYAQILDHGSLPEVMPDSEERRAFAEALVHAWGTEEMTKGRIAGTLAALKKAIQLTAQNEFRSRHLAPMALSWAIEGLKRGQSDLVLEWLAHKDVLNMLEFLEGSKQERLLLVGLAYLQAGKFSAGRAALEDLFSGNPDPAFAAQARFLHSLSLLAETKDWERPEAGGDEAGSADVQLETMWRVLRARLERAVGELTRAPSGLVWRGHLLKGLIAYVDSEATPPMADLEQFGAAIEQVDSRRAKSRLKAVEGVLLTRAKATDEAIGYVQRRSYGELRTLQDEVLAPLGDAIPAQVRAAVYMTLWEGEPDYDPMSDLQRIPSPGDSDDPTAVLISDCVAQVRMVGVMQELAQQCAQPPGRLRAQVPSLESLSSNEGAASLGGLAAAVIRLRQEDWRGALDTLDAYGLDGQNGEDGIDQMAEYVRFYAAWKLQDLDTCTAVGANRFLERSKDWRPAMQGRRLLAALDERNMQVVGSLLPHGDQPDELVEPLGRVAVGLLKRRQPELALTLCHWVQNEILESNNRQAPDLRWWLHLWTGLAAAQAGQYTVAIQSVDSLLSVEAPQRVDDRRARQLQGLAKLIKLEAELALVAGSSDGDDVATRWPSVRRSLTEQAQTLTENQELMAYGSLIAGLVSYLTADILVDEATVSRLQQAQQALRVTRHTGFLENVLGRLRWRRKVLVDFWASLQQGDFKESRSIYQVEIQPVFGDRVPYAIQLGMVIVDWDTGAYQTAELLNRLAILEHEATGISPEMIQQTRKYIQDAEQTRRFTELVKRKDYDEIIAFVERSSWVTAMPVPVAIAQLHALYKKKRHEDAKRFGRVITDTPRLAPWVRDYGYLILGYLLYDNEEYEEAAQAFEEIHVSELLGRHNTDRYWAAAHYARGLQYLDKDKKVEAFDSFRRSLGQRKAAASTASLAPLFTYFGLQNLEARNGNRARQAFTLLTESVEGLKDSPDVARSRLLGGMGLLLCDALLSDHDHKPPPAGKAFLELADRVGAYGAVLPRAEQHIFENTFHRMAICQELRKERSQPPRRRLDKSKLQAFVVGQVEALEKLPKLRGGVDPVLLVLMGLNETHFKSQVDVDKALEHFMAAARLGLTSRNLAGLISELTKRKQRELDSQAAIVDLFDLYLLAGSLPPELLKYMNQSDAVSKLYRQSRGYAPQEIARAHDQALAAVTEERIEHLKSAVTKTRLAEDKHMTELLVELDKQLESLKAAERALLNQEQEVITTVAGQIHSEEPLQDDGVEPIDRI